MVDVFSYQREGLLFKIGGLAGEALGFNDLLHLSRMPGLPKLIKSIHIEGQGI